MNFTSPLPGRCLAAAPTLILPIKGNYLGSLKRLWSRFCGWHHMDWHKTCSLNPRVYSVLDESIFQTFCFHINIGSKSPALTPWAAEFQKKSCILFLGKGRHFSFLQGFYRGSREPVLPIKGFLIFVGNMGTPRDLLQVFLCGNRIPQEFEGLLLQLCELGQ